MNNLREAEDILLYFGDWPLDKESRTYLLYHHRRYEFLLRRVDWIVAKIQSESHDEAINILDVGPGFQTEILRKTLPEAVVNTLGFEDTRFTPRPQDRHFQFDLNDAQYQERWPTETLRRSKPDSAQELAPGSNCVLQEDIVGGRSSRHADWQ